MSWKERATEVKGWQARARPVADVGSPLDKALAEQTGDVVTVDTPQGPAKFTRAGERFFDAEESQAIADSTEPMQRTRSLQALLSLMSGGGPLMDEARGFDAGARAFLRNEGNPVDAYRQVRDETRAEVDRATRDVSPMVEVGGVKLPLLPALGAALPSLIAPNPVTIMGRIGLGSATAGMQAAGESRADLTRGEVAPFAREVGGAAAAGAGVTAAMEPVAYGMQKLATGAGERIGDVVATRAAKDVADVASETASLRGQLGAESQVGSRLQENLQRAASGITGGPSPVGDETQLAAALALADPSASRLASKTTQNALTQLPGQTQRIMGLEHDLAEKVAMGPSEAAGRTSGYFAGDAFAQEIDPRVKRQLVNALIGAGTGTPASLGMMAAGVSPGTALAGGMGTGASLGLSKGAITSARNAAKSPLVQVDALGLLANDALEARQGAFSAARTTGTVMAEEDSISAFLRGN